MCNFFKNLNEMKLFDTHTIKSLFYHKKFRTKKGWLVFWHALFGNSSYYNTIKIWWSLFHCNDFSYPSFHHHVKYLSISSLLYFLFHFSFPFFSISCCVRVICFPLLYSRFWTSYILPLWIYMLSVVFVESDCLEWVESSWDQLVGSFAHDIVLSIQQIIFQLRWSKMALFLQIHFWYNYIFEPLHQGGHILWWPW